jgi:glycerol-3-phosphate dehydrogenase (NAD(P)+)
MRYRVAILGAGAIGQALREVLSKRADAELWDKNASRVPSQRALQRVVGEADFLFFCMNSWHLREAIRMVKEKLETKSPYPVFLSKGLEQDSWLTVDEVVEAAWSDLDTFALLSGPMLAEELRNGWGGGATVATIDQTLYARIEDLLQGSGLTLEYTYDVHGVALAGVLKNVYAIALGMAQALPLGSNATGLLVQQALKEMREMLTTLGGREETLMGMAGVADFIATGFSKASSNNQLGSRLIREGKIGDSSEGSVSTPSLKHLIDQYGGYFPLFATVDRAISHPDRARAVFEQYIQAV